MTKNSTTPTEALLQVAKVCPFAPAVCTGSATWSYAELWTRVRELSEHIDRLDQTRAPIGLHMRYDDVVLHFFRVLLYAKSRD